MHDNYRVAQRLLAVCEASDIRADSRAEEKQSHGVTEFIIAGVIPVLFMGLACVVPSVICLAILTLSPVVIASTRHAQYRRRSEALERDLPALITSLAASVRAGVDPIRALTDARHYFAATSPWCDELEKFRAGLSRGLDEDQAIDQLCSGDEHPDVQLLKKCLLLSRRHGSSLAEPLHRIARVVRQRQSFRRKTRAALAMHRLSACGIGVCAVLIGAMQAIMNRAGLQVVAESTMGISVMSSGALCVVVGLYWMFRMGREERK